MPAVRARPLAAALGAVALLAGCASAGGAGVPEAADTQGSHARAAGLTADRFDESRARLLSLGSDLPERPGGQGSDSWLVVTRQKFDESGHGFFGGRIEGAEGACGEQAQFGIIALESLHQGGYRGPGVSGLVGQFAGGGAARLEIALLQLLDQGGHVGRLGGSRKGEAPG